MDAPETTDRSRARLRQELKRLGGRGDGIADQQRDDRADYDTQRTDQRGHTDDEGAGREQREGDRHVVPLQHPEPNLRTAVSVVRQSPITSIGSTGGNGSPCRKATSCVTEAIADTSISATSFASGPP
jgi:hypothetical protein